MKKYSKEGERNIKNVLRHLEMLAELLLFFLMFNWFWLLAFLFFYCTFKEEPNSTVVLASARLSVVGCDFKMNN